MFNVGDIVRIKKDSGVWITSREGKKLVISRKIENEFEAIFLIDNSETNIWENEIFAIEKIKLNKLDEKIYKKILEKYRRSE